MRRMIYPISMLFLGGILTVFCGGCTAKASDPATTTIGDRGAAAVESQAIILDPSATTEQRGRAIRVLREQPVCEPPELWAKAVTDPALPDDVRYVAMKLLVQRFDPTGHDLLAWVRKYHLEAWFTEQDVVDITYGDYTPFMSRAIELGILGRTHSTFAVDPAVTFLISPEVSKGDLLTAIHKGEWPTTDLPVPVVLVVSVERFPEWDDWYWEAQFYNHLDQ